MLKWLQYSRAQQEWFPCSLGHISGVYGWHHDHRPPLHLAGWRSSGGLPALSTQLWHKSAPDVTVPTGHEDRSLPPPSQAVPGVVTRSQVSASMSSDSARPRCGVAPRAPPHREAPPAGTSEDVVPLVPLARNVDAWLALSSPSRGLIRTVRLGCAIHFAGHPPRSSGVHFTLVKDGNTATLRGDRYPPTEGRERTCPSSRDEEGVLQPLLQCTEKRRWVAANLGPASTEPGLTQTPIQDADAKTHSSERLASRLVRGGRPEGCVLSRLDPSSTQTLPAVRVRGSGVSVQSPPFRPVPVSSRLCEDRRGCPCPVKGGGHSHSQLSRRLANPSSLSRWVMRTQGPGALTPQPTRASGQLGKEQAPPGSEHLLSRFGVGLSLLDGAPYERARPVGAGLFEGVQTENSGSTETFSEAPGAYGILGGGHPARVDAYEAASALAPDSSPEMGMVPWDTPRGHYVGLSPSFQPLDRPLVSTSRCSARTGLQARRGHDRCLQNELGRCWQWARSHRPLDGSAAALAHQLPRVTGNSACPAEVPAVDPGQARASSDRQHGSGSICQPPRRSALPLYVITRPPSPPTELAAPSRCKPLTSQATSTLWRTRRNNRLPSRESGDSTFRWSS
ncbi:uncharacterized protein LOC127447729 [Myxocyprinus asiaticus]|uniref:uncharacterized protein LOC127447729 n=1 Tax=Myxocyprinus asiaticus TaxID=70543 RepID=UPI002222F401|nr:uncharacterized protein LOC127447729 [Myxocyprinus asiaticus]